MAKYGKEGNGNGKGKSNGGAHSTYGAGGKAQCVVEPGSGNHYPGGADWAGGIEEMKANHPTHRPHGTSYDGQIRKRNTGA
jgi:hypothetical protein